MKLLIVEDELPIARYIERQCRAILGDRLTSVKTIHSLSEAGNFLFEHEIDLCLLDLNLNGEDGYDLLKKAVSGAFYTIVISANTDRAAEAFEYGVLDFVAKPFDEERLGRALQRYFDTSERNDIGLHYLAFRKYGQTMVIAVEDVVYFQAAGVYVEAHLKNGTMEILDKSLDKLVRLLPGRFLRTHRSFLVDVTQIQSYGHQGGGSYVLEMKTGQKLPLSRHKYKDLQALMNY